MAYVSQDLKKKIAAALKPVVPKGWKYSLAVRNHSTIVMTIASAPVDLIDEWVTTRSLKCSKPDTFSEGLTHVQVNEFWLQEQFDANLPVFEAIKAALNIDNRDRSDIMTDYFDVGHYVDINLGRWNKPFIVTK